MTGEARTFHAPALVAQALMALFSLGALAGTVSLFLYAFLGLALLSWQVAAGLCLVSAAGILACLWWVTLPHPVLIVDGAGLDWRLLGTGPERIGWDRIAGYALRSPEELARLGHVAPPEKRNERCLAIRLHDRADLLAAFEADIAQGLDEALAALRQWRPDLEWGA